MWKTSSNGSGEAVLEDEAGVARARKAAPMRKVQRKNKLRTIDVLTLVAVVGTILGGLLTL